MALLQVWNVLDFLALESNGKSFGFKVPRSSKVAQVKLSLVL